MQRPSDITTMLADICAGDRSAIDSLMPLVYDELRALAERQLRSERSDHTLQATALANEAYLKLVDQRDVKWQSRAHFLAVAAQAIRRILVDHARGKGRHKREGARQRLSLTTAEPIAEGETEGPEVVALDAALTRLAARWPEHARVVELRFFGGMTTREVAEVTGVTTRTVERYWQFARTWLFREMSDADADNET